MKIEENENFLDDTGSEGTKENPQSTDSGTTEDSNTEEKNEEPPASENTEEAKRPNVTDTISKIDQIDDVELVKPFLSDDRVTVKKAAQKRIEALSAPSESAAPASGKSEDKIIQISQKDLQDLIDKSVKDAVKKSKKSKKSKGSESVDVSWKDEKLENPVTFFSRSSKFTLYPGVKDANGDQYRMEFQPTERYPKFTGRRNSEMVCISLFVCKTKGEYDAMVNHIQFGSKFKLSKADVKDESAMEMIIRDHVYARVASMNMSQVIANAKACKIDDNPNIDVLKRDLKAHYYLEAKKAHQQKIKAAKDEAAKAFDSNASRES